jgi:prolyl oligopeptidase
MRSVILASLLAAANLSPPPAAPRRPVTDVYHGVSVEDPYRWLENGRDPEVQAWSRAQDARTRAFLSSLPGAEPIRARVRELVLATQAQYQLSRPRGGTYFAQKFQPPRQQPFVVALASPDDLASERTVLDPVALDPSGATSIDFFAPSPDGKLLAASLSEKGSESGDVRLFDTATGKELADRVPRVNGGTAGGGVAWNADGTGFWYTRYPRPGERPEADLGFYQEIWFHRLGTPTAQDVYELGREFDDPRIAEHFLRASDDGRNVLSLVQKADGREFALYLRRPEGGWRKVSGLTDEVVAARFGLDGGLWLLSRKGSPRGRILRVPLEAPELGEARVVAEAAEGAIASFEVTASRLYVNEVVGGPSQVRLFDLDGKPRGLLPVEPATAIDGPQRLGPDAVVYSATSHRAPLAWYRADDATLSPRKLAASSRSPVDFSDVEALREVALSKDGTSPAHLAIIGGSNGGLLMGAILKQHPSLARAVVAAVGLFDMLRVELHPNGAYNVTEFGTVKDRAQFEALRAYSPYHHVEAGVRYPAVLLTAGDRGPRVDAYHARKMAARLQASTASRYPVLLRVSGFGHGMGTSLDERIAEIADVDTFLFQELGVPIRVSESAQK